MDIYRRRKFEREKKARWRAKNPDYAKREWQKLKLRMASLDPIERREYERKKKAAYRARQKLKMVDQI